GLKNLLPNGGLGQSNKEQLATLRTTVNEAVANPTKLTEHLANATQPLRDAGMSKIADAYTDHQLRLMKVIQAILPKDPTMAAAHPFAQTVDIDDISPETRTKL